MITKKFVQKSVFYSVLAMALVMPMSNSVNANSSMMTDYQAYPTPVLKPLNCTNSMEMHDENYINQRQAAAAALGLYLGIKQATAPQVKSEEKTNLCA